MEFRATLATVIFVVLSAASMVSNAQSIENDRFSLRVGAFFLEDSDTEISLRGENAPIGTTVNFNRDLGVEETLTTARAAGYYRFTPRHRIDFEWYEMDRDGTRTADREIVFRDQTFTPGSGVRSSIETSIQKLAYTWSFHHEDPVELGLSFGAYALEYDLQLSGPQGNVPVDESVTAPLPMFGFRTDYSINPRWHLLFDVETFYVEVEDDTRGSMDSLKLALEYRPFDHFGVGVSASRLAMDLRLQDDYRWNVSDLYRGVEVYASLHF